MEDSHIANVDLGDGNSLFAVFDGHGGQACSLFCKRYFCEELKKNAKYQQKDYKSALEQNFLRIDDMMRSKNYMKELQQWYPRKMVGPPGQQELESVPASVADYQGCTATVLLVTPDQLVCANAGDSRTILSLNGHTVPLSSDHKPNQELELKRIEKAGYSVQSNRISGQLAVARAIGDFNFKDSKDPFKCAVSAHPDVTFTKLDEECQFVVLACDGLWDMKSSKEVVDFFHAQLYEHEFGQQERHIDEMKYFLEGIIDEACIVDKSKSKEGLGTDNISAIFVEIKPTYPDKKDSD